MSAPIPTLSIREYLARPRPTLEEVKKRLFDDRDSLEEKADQEYRAALKRDREEKLARKDQLPEKKHKHHHHHHHHHHKHKETEAETDQGSDKMRKEPVKLSDFFNSTEEKHKRDKGKSSASSSEESGGDSSSDSSDSKHKHHKKRSKKNHKHKKQENEEGKAN